MALSPTSGPDHEPVIASGSGFAIDSGIVIAFDGAAVGTPNCYAPYFCTDGSGNLIAAAAGFFVPSGATPGPHTVTVTDSSGDFATATFTVTSGTTTSNGGSTTSSTTSSASYHCPTGSSADAFGICIVIGQPDLTTLTAGQPASPTAIGNPTAVVFDSKGELWVVDTSNNRVLDYKPPISTGEAASLVIGQTSLTATGDSSPSGGLFGPTDVAFDSTGNLWVVDSGNNRVLEFKAPFSDGEPASLVLGQPTFGGYIGTTTSGGLNSPSYLAFDSSGDLWVTDQGNNRVLEFSAPFSTGQKASVVIGQENFTAFAPASTVTARSLFEPLGIAFDAKGNLWVVDSADHRILEYNAPFSTDEAANSVIGQPSLTSSSSLAGLNAYAIAFDSTGNLWVSDGINGVAEYFAPLSTGEAGSQVIGPKTVTDGGTAPGSRLSDPQGIALDSGDNLWVADYGHGRVLEYGSGVTTSTSSSSSSATTSSTSGGAVPVFPYQLAVAAAFTVLLAASYLFIRRGSHKAMR